jgi:hypothetical protein
VCSVFRRFRSTTIYICIYTSWALPAIPTTEARRKGLSLAPGEFGVPLASKAGRSRPRAARTMAVAGVANVAEFNARGFTIVPNVFSPAEMRSLGATVTELAAAEVEAIGASGVSLEPSALDWSTAEEYAAWQDANPDWQRTIVAMSKVQVMPSGEIIGRKLNTPAAADFPASEAFRRVALDPRMTALASSLLGGRKALLYSDQCFIKPPDLGGPKPWVRAPHTLLVFSAGGSGPCCGLSDAERVLAHSIKIIGTLGSQAATTC